MPKNHRFSKEELIQHLEKQQRLLKKSCDEFDRGDKDEILRIALHVRILVHVTDQSKGLLRQINPGYQLFDTCPVVEPARKNTIFGAGMLQFDLSKARWVVKSRSQPRKVHYREWWEQKIVILKGKEISRKYITLQIANQDGGAHVDAVIDRLYHTMSRQGIFEIAIGGKPTKTFPSHELLMRQIEKEVLDSLEVNHGNV